MTKSISRKIKKRLKSIFRSKILSCFCINHQNDHLPAPMPMSQVVPNPNETLQHVLVKLLDNQLEERESQKQLNNTLTAMTSVLEQLTRNVIPFPANSSKTFSKIIVKSSKNSFSGERKSLTVINGRSVNLMLRSQPCLRDQCLMYIDKGIQSSLSFSTFTQTKLVQTNNRCVTSFSNFDLYGFKIDLLRHIRTLKQDVITLRRFMYHVDYNSSSLTTHPWALRGYEHKFFEAKARAKNFVRFYTMVNKTKKKNRQKKVE